MILNHYGITPKTMRNDDDLAKANQVMKDYWRLCITEIDVFKSYIECLEKGKTLEKLRKENLLLKPVAHMALAHATSIILDAGCEFETLIPKINKIDWSINNPVWTNILVTNTANKKMIAGAQAYKNAGGIIAYMLIGDKVPLAERERLLSVIKEAADDENVKLPDVIE